jgi:hypothetical protein
MVLALVACITNYRRFSVAAEIQLLVITYNKFTTRSIAYIHPSYKMSKD